LDQDRTLGMSGRITATRSFEETRKNMIRILRVNLSERSSSEEGVPDEIIERYVGPKGISSHMLLREVPPTARSLGPDNKLMFSCGPLSGSTMPGTSRIAVHFLSPLTGGYGEAYSGGNLATQFARTGWRMVIVEGKAASPVFLEISEEGATFHAADDLWGLDIFAAEEALLERVNVKGSRATVIGPAGENQVHFACMINDHTHALGRGGMGAVAGAKNLKGLVFHGQIRPVVARPQELKELVKEMIEQATDHPAVASFRRWGTMAVVPSTNGADMFPTHYWQKGRLDGWEEKIGPDMMVEKYKVKNTTCPPCLLQCGNLCRVPEGPLAGLENEPEFETVYAFAGLCEVGDLAQVMRMNDICDRLGMDTMTAGGLAGLAIEACAQGRLDLGLEYGDPDGVAEFLMKMARREGEVASVFADGVLAVEKAYGLEDVAVHVKGMEPAGYDPRRSKGMGLGYIMSERGACHQRATFMKAELSGLIDIDQVKGKAAMYVDWENRFVVMDCMIFCHFYRDLLDWDFITRISNAAVGLNDTPDELRAKANRIVGETHEFNRLRGFAAGRERFGKWLTERPIIAKNGDALRTTSQDYQIMREEYYAARGWGKPAAV
jgi:aldehyde:ferredoxin oxidoreductase